MNHRSTGRPTSPQRRRSATRISGAGPPHRTWLSRRAPERRVAKPRSRTSCSRGCRRGRSISCSCRSSSGTARGPFKPATPGTRWAACELRPPCTRAGSGCTRGCSGSRPVPPTPPWTRWRRRLPASRTRSSSRPVTWPPGLRRAGISRAPARCFPTASTPRGPMRRRSSNTPVRFATSCSSADSRRARACISSAAPWPTRRSCGTTWIR